MLYLSTTEGVFRVNPDNGPDSKRVAQLGPAATSTEALAVSGEVLVAAVTPDYGVPMRNPLKPAGRRGMVRSPDGGQTWTPVQDGAGVAIGQEPVTALAASEEMIIAGTDPAELLASHNGGQTWTRGQSLREMPGYDRWSYPLAPHTPHVMVIVPHPAEANTIYAGIEVGGIVRSDDHGQTWRVVGDRGDGAGESVHPDIHGLAICPAAPAVMYASTPQGMFYSEDGGERWQRRIEGLDPLYCRPVVVHQQEPAVAVVVATHGASGFFGMPAERTGGAVLRTEDAGRTWRRVAEGLPSFLAPTASMSADPNTPGRFFLPLFSGEVYVTEDGGIRWQELATGLPPILRTVAV